jgi:hypothetical protein
MMIDAAVPKWRREVLAVNMVKVSPYLRPSSTPLWAKLLWLWGNLWKTGQIQQTKEKSVDNGLGIIGFPLPINN